MSTLTISIQHCVGGSSHSNWARTKNKKHLDLKGRNKTISGDMILYIEKSQESTNKLLELINEFISVVGYKINTESSTVCIYTCNEK